MLPGEVIKFRILQQLLPELIHTCHRPGMLYHTGYLTHRWINHNHSRIILLTMHGILAYILQKTVRRNMLLQLLAQ